MTRRGYHGYAYVSNFDLSLSDTQGFPFQWYCMGTTCKEIVEKSEKQRFCSENSVEPKLQYLLYLIFIIMQWLKDWRLFSTDHLAHKLELELLGITLPSFVG